MGGSRRTSNISVLGFTPPAGVEMIVDVNRIAPEYTTTLGLPLLLGREFTEHDGPESPQVAIVNEAFVRAYSPGENVVGRRLGFGDEVPESDAIEIVGVVGDAKYNSPREKPERMVFLPLFQAKDQSGYWTNLEIRTAGAPSSLEAAVREAVADVDSRVPVAEVTTLERQVSDSLRRDQLLAQLVSVFGTLAVFLACVGLYGVVSQAVARRTSEVGIRMALGAEPGHILTMVLREAGTLILLGFLLGVPLAFVATRFLGSQLFGVTPGDPITFAATSILLVAVAVAAGYVPARRASRVDPIVALRME
jgi:predicted permease